MEAINIDKGKTTKLNPPLEYIIHIIEGFKCFIKMQSY